MEITIFAAQESGCDGTNRTIRVESAFSGLRPEFVTGFKSKGRREAAFSFTETSAVGTFETCRDVRCSVAIRGTADMAGIAQFGRD
jgi:hypothetical protein